MAPITDREGAHAGSTQKFGPVRQRISCSRTVLPSGSLIAAYRTPPTSPRRFLETRAQQDRARGAGPRELDDPHALGRADVDVLDEPELVDVKAFARSTSATGIGTSSSFISMPNCPSACAACTWTRTIYRSRTPSRRRLPAASPR